MYYSPTKLKRLYLKLGAKNRCLIEGANRVRFLYLSLMYPPRSLIAGSHPTPWLVYTRSTKEWPRKCTCHICHSRPSENFLPFQIRWRITKQQPWKNTWNEWTWHSLHGKEFLPLCSCLVIFVYMICWDWTNIESITEPYVKSLMDNITKYLTSRCGRLMWQHKKLGFLVCHKP